MRKIFVILIVLFLLSCEKNTEEVTTDIKVQKGVSIVVLGTLQDAGAPHIACTKSCCTDLFTNPDKSKKVVSLGIIDNENKKKYLIEATPDLSQQVKTLKLSGFNTTKEVPDGVFLTHAHIGHYTGLMYFGKEAMNADSVSVYAMPKMKNFLETNGPWSQLVNLGNIKLQSLFNEIPIKLSEHLTVIPFQVPHRDEYSETVGFKVVGPNKSAIFIPDIDKWEKWNKSIIEEIEKVDYAFLDATFFDGVEINNRDISEIPHPFIIESMKKFESLSEEEKSKVIFIHFNHTNPVINENSVQAKSVLKSGFKLARIGDNFSL